MKVFRIVMHGLVLTVMDIAAIIVAFGLYKMINAPDQITFQGPAAALLAIGGFTLWSWLVKRFFPQGLTLIDAGEHAIVYLLAFIWAVVLFVPLHFITQGYLTTFSNIEVLWIFQVPVDLLALFAAFLAEGKKLHISMTP